DDRGGAWPRPVRVHEEGRRSRRRHRCGELARDVARLADADDDDAAAAVEERARSGDEGGAEAPVQRADRGGLRREHLAAQRQRALRVETAHGRRRRHDRCGHALKYTPKRSLETGGAVLHSTRPGRMPHILLLILLLLAAAV